MAQPTTQTESMEVHAARRGWSRSHPPAHLPADSFMIISVNPGLFLQVRLGREKMDRSSADPMDTPYGIFLPTVLATRSGQAAHLSGKGKGQTGGG